MVWLELGILAIGFAVLTQSASEAIRRVIRLSRQAHLSEFAISFAVVGLISILPELSIALNAALNQNPSLGLGIVFGANIADLTLVIGIVALFSQSIKIHGHALKDGGILAILVALPAIFLLDGSLSRTDGFFLIAAFAAYVYKTLHRKTGVPNHNPNRHALAWKDWAVLAICVVLLLASGHFITDAAQSLGLSLGIPLFFVGIVLAVGTCLPELTVSLQSNFKKHGEIGFGDILGNVFADCTLTIGIIALISPFTPDYPQLAWFSGLLMVGSLLLVLYWFKANRQITPRHGAALIVLYVIFLVAQFFLEKALIAG